MANAVYLVGASAEPDAPPSVLFDFDRRGDARRAAEALLRGVSRPLVWVWVRYAPSMNRHAVVWWTNPQRVAAANVPPALPSPSPVSCPIEGCAGADHPLHLVSRGVTVVRGDASGGALVVVPGLVECGECARHWTPASLLEAWRTRGVADPLLIIASVPGTPVLELANG